MDEVIQRFPGGLVAPEQWLDLVAPKLPNVPPDLIKHEVLGILRDFCKRGGVWRDWLKPIVISGEVREYILETSNPGNEVTNVLSVVDQITRLPLTPWPPELAVPLHMITHGGPPKWFLSEHQYAVVDGVLGRLLRVAGPNYRPADAGVHWTQYVSARNAARTRSIAGYNRATTQPVFPYFARGSQR
jgi:hypothetical protein